MKDSNCKERVKSLRALTGLSQKAFAELYDIPARTYEAWETGRREAPVYVVNLLEHAVNSGYKKVQL